MIKAILIGMLVLFGVAGIGQDRPVTVFADRNFGFEFSYPAAYRIAELPCSLAQSAAIRGWQSLLYASTGEARSDGNISVILDRRRFSLATLKESYSRAGEEPTRVRFGEYIFYYYGRGGGGVSYPDEYFYNLDGYILEIMFDGP